MTTVLKPANTLTQLGSLSGAQLGQLGIRYAPRIVAGLAVVGIAWQAAQLTWLFLAPTPTAAPIVAVGAPATIAATSVNPQSIADAHLFGVAGAGGGAADPNNLPKSQTSLVLSGTMALEDPEAGFAIVGENTANAKFYRVGAVINGVARLHSVYPERVIIERNGALETLVLPRGIPSNAPMPMARNMAPAPNANPVGENLRRLAANNPSALGELLRAQPVFSNGVQKGYRVYPGRDRQQFVRLGLQPGDLVTSVNGSTLDDPNRSSEILNTLTASSTAQITIERNGTNQQLTLDMAQISLPDSTPIDAPPSGVAPSMRNPNGVPSPQPGSPGAQ